MCNLESLKIDLKELNEGLTTLNFNLGDAYFESLDEDEIKRGSVSVSLNVRRTENYFELDFHTAGSVVIPCDLCLDDMDQDVESDDRLIVKFGEEYSEDDDLITVDEREGVLDVAWFIYEFIALNIPAKHVHTPGKCTLNFPIIRRQSGRSASLFWWTPFFPQHGVLSFLCAGIIAEMAAQTRRALASPTFTTVG